MTSKLGLCAAIVALLAVAPIAVGHDVSAQTRNCTQVGFTPNSDDVASQIRATGLTCGLARDFIRDSRGRPGSSFRGFRCASVEVSDNLPYARYRCTGAGDVIRWRRY